MKNVIFSDGAALEPYHWSMGPRKQLKEEWNCCTVMIIYKSKDRLKSATIVNEFTSLEDGIQWLKNTIDLKLIPTVYGD